MAKYNVYIISQDKNWTNKAEFDTLREANGFARLISDDGYTAHIAKKPEEILNNNIFSINLFWFFVFLMIVFIIILIGVIC